MHIELKDAENIKLQHPQDTYEIIRKIFYERKKEVDLMKEHLWAFSLNTALKILNIELVHIGTKDRTLADPGDVFRVPLYKSSSYVILVHNHTSGDLQPSKPDLDITNKFMKAGDILDIPVIDHIIVTERSFFSFKTAGLMEQLEQDNKYALTFVYKKKMERKMEELKASVEREKREFGIQKKKEGIKEGEEKGAKKRDREMARTMLSKGMDTKTIQEITGLSKQWIGRIKNEIENEQNSN